MNLVEQSLQIPAGGVALDADLAVPEPQRGVVLFAHGSGSSRHSPRNRYVAGELQASASWPTCSPPGKGNWTRGPAGSGSTSACPRRE